MTRTLMAIVGDTWRQSKQQVVFLLLIGVMVLYALGVVFASRVVVTPKGTYVLVTAFQKEADSGIEVVWDATYRAAVAGERMERELGAERQQLEALQEKLFLAAQAVERVRLQGQSEEARKPTEQTLEQAKQEFETKRKAFEEHAQKLNDEAQAIVEQRSPGITPLEKGVEVWLQYAASFLVLLSLVGFIAAASGYFPAMLTAGAIDVLVSKPVPRYQIFIGKYLGGLALFSAALVLTYLVMFAGIGFKTGVWHIKLFAGIPVTLFCAGLLYACVAFLGIFTRSTPLAMIGGYVYYLVVEVAISAIQNPALSQLHIDWLTSVSEISRWVFPGFGRLRDAVGAAVLDVPVFDWQPIAVGAVWLCLLLGSSFAWFRRLDF